MCATPKPHRDRLLLGEKQSGVQAKGAGKTGILSQSWVPLLPEAECGRKPMEQQPWIAATAVAPLPWPATMPHILNA
jgi:hypothetical protein